MLIGTAGHIDHGKTALIRALTGVDTARLPEERRRGMTIELGYAYMPFAEDQGGVLAFIDVPGHERLVATMLTGAAGIDFALLVVAADDGPMPQTREHLAILQLLGIKRAAVALTKCDRVDSRRIEEAAAEIRMMLGTTPLSEIPLFATSLYDDAGIEALRRHLCGEAVRQRRRPDDGGFRLAIDRHFAVAGAGTVVTGTAYAGRVAVADHLIVSRGDGFLREVRVRNLHVSNRPAAAGAAGQRCALNLAGIDHHEICRGDWLCASGLSKATQRLDLRLHLLPQATKPLRQWQGVHLHHAAGKVQAHIALLDDSLEQGGLRPGENALVQAVLDRPILACHGDRIVIRDAAGAMTLGGGQVLDPFPPARHRRRPQRLACLATQELTDPERRLQALLDASPLGVDGEALMSAHNLVTERWLPAVARKEIIRLKGPKNAFHLFALQHWEALAQRVTDCLRDYHARCSDEAGVERDRLRRLCFPQLSPWIFSGCLENLREAQRICCSGSAWHLPGHRVELLPAEQAKAERLLNLIEARAFDPPWVRELADATDDDEREVRRLLRSVASRGEVFQVVKDLFYSAHQIGRLAETAAAIVAEERRAQPESPAPIRAAEFRDRIGCGRKRAIQILEFFDRVGYTRRIGVGSQRVHLIRGEPPVLPQAIREQT